MNGLDINFFDNGRCITIKEYAFGTNHMGEFPAVPPIPRVGDMVMLDDMPYTVEAVRHDWAEPRGKFLGVIVTVHVRQDG